MTTRCKDAAGTDRGPEDRSRRELLHRLGALVVSSPVLAALLDCRDGDTGALAEPAGAGSVEADAGSVDASADAGPVAADAGSADASVAAAGRAADPEPSPSCVLSPQETEGPFYFDPQLLRSDIHEGLPGTALRVRLRVLDVNADCAPIANVAVDLWHADIGGVYSGYAGQAVDTTGATYLRGRQITDRNGRVEFATLYPGWYPSRAPHAHFKVHLTSTTAVSSQFYFPETVNREVYLQGAYAVRGLAAVGNASDGIANPPSGSHLPALLADVTRVGAGYVADLAIGIAR